MYDLKRCPFCGGKPFFRVYRSNSSSAKVGFDFTITCGKCKVELPDSFGVSMDLNNDGEITILADGRDAAVKAWNNRVPVVTLDDAEPRTIKIVPLDWGEQ